MGILQRASNLFDGWRNTVTKLGTKYSHLSHHTVATEDWVSCEELGDLYYSDPFAQRAIREPIEAAFRQGWDLVPPADAEPERSDEQGRAIRDLLWELGAEEHLKDALGWGGLYGRGGLMIGTVDSAPMSEPLVPETVRELVYFEPLECDDFSAHTYQEDPDARDFGEPLTWRISRHGGTKITSNEIVHSSRILLTRGAPTSKRRRQLNQWRDASLLQAPYNHLRGWDVGVQSAAAMFSDSSQAVLHIDDMLSLVNDDDTLQDRLRVMEMARSFKILPVDAAREKFEFVERTFSGAEKVLEMLMLSLCGALGMPVTVLFGRSPAGLSATGESDMRLWYDQVGQRRTQRYQPLLESLVYLAAIVTGAECPEEWGVSWPSLWQMTASEQAEHRSQVAATDLDLVVGGVLTEDEVARHRFGEGGWGTEIAVDWDERERLETEEEDDEPPPPPIPGDEEEAEVPESDDEEAEGGEEA